MENEGAAFQVFLPTGNLETHIDDTATGFDLIDEKTDRFSGVPETLSEGKEVGLFRFLLRQQPGGLNRVHIGKGIHNSRDRLDIREKERAFLTRLMIEDEETV